MNGLFDQLEAEPEMAVTALAPWFGSKRTLASSIVKEFSEHRAYWEPFCASMAVLLEKSPCTMETANDLHGDIINLARVIAAEPTGIQLYSALERTVMHEDLFHEAAARYRERGNIPAGEDLDVPRAIDFMICSWYGRNGVAGTQSYNQGFCTRYTKNGGHGATRWCSAVDSIPAWHRRLRHVTILNRDAFELLERIEDADKVVIYCDPPYLVKGAKYIHDFAGEDHGRLAELLRRFKSTQVLVSYYDAPELDELYPRWRKVKFNVNKALAHQNNRDGKGATKAPEVLLVNR